MKLKNDDVFKIYAFVLILAGMISLIGFGTTQRIFCTKDDFGTVDCYSQVLWMEILPVWKEQKLENVESVNIETNCFTEGTTNTERCAKNVLVIKATSSEMIIGPFFLNEITILQAQKQVQKILNEPITMVKYSGKNLANMILGNIFVTVPCLTLGIMLARGDKRK
ncbi:MAG: hypothetical protein FP831_03395 [Anaerolineae bacterium]|nr:hypothetical protein [Anaerolineae bacterium]